MWVEGCDTLLTLQCARAGWATGQARFVTREVDVQAGGHGSGLAPAEASVARGECGRRRWSSELGRGRQTVTGVGLLPSRGWSREGSADGADGRWSCEEVGHRRVVLSG